LITNPSFETDTTSWTLTGTSQTRINTTAFSGSWCNRITCNGSTLNGISTSTRIAITAGSKYACSAYFNVPTGQPQINAGIRLRFYNAATGGTLIQQVQNAGQIAVAGTTWERSSLLVTAPTGATHVVVDVINYASTVAGQLFHIDAVLFELSTILRTYFDGSTAGASWTGTANASTSILPNALDWAFLQNVQQISGSIGRQQLQDVFEPSSMKISARYPNGFSAPNSSLVVNTQVRVKRTGSAYTMWTGRIRNVSVEWGIPYNSGTGTGVADFVNIECEGALAQWGRLQGNGLFVTAGTIRNQIGQVVAGTNLNYGTTYTAENEPSLSASEVTDSLSNWLNTECFSVGATIKDGGGTDIGVYGRDWLGNLPVSFSDVTNNESNQAYDNIVFDSVSADYFTEIELNTYSYGDVVVTTGTAPFRTLRQTTFNASASQATDLANYLLGIYGDNGFGISSISCNSEAQNSWALDLGYGWWDIIGYTTYVYFRGQTFRCTVLGSDFSATPEGGSRFTYYLADVGLTPFLVLDDTTFGILDTNKLGW